MLCGKGRSACESASPRGLGDRPSSRSTSTSRVEASERVNEPDFVRHTWSELDSGGRINW